MVQALSSIIQSSSSDNVDISFVEQSMMSAIDNVADKVTVCTLCTVRCVIPDFRIYRKLRMWHQVLFVWKSWWISFAVSPLSFLRSTVSSYCFYSCPKSSDVPASVVTYGNIGQADARLCTPQYHACFHVHGVKCVPPRRYVQLYCRTKGTKLLFASYYSSLKFYY